MSTTDKARDEWEKGDDDVIKSLRAERDALKGECDALKVELAEWRECAGKLKYCLNMPCSLSLQLMALDAYAALAGKGEDKT